MTAIPRAAGHERLHGASMALSGLAAGLVILDAVTGVVSGGIVDVVGFVVFTLAFVGMTAAGVLLITDPRHAGLGRMLLGVAAAGALYDLTGWLDAVGPSGFLHGVVYWGYAGLLAHLLVRWPDDRVTGRTSRGLLAVMYLVMPALSLVWQLTWEARWFDDAARSWWWVTLVPARGFSAPVWQVQQILLVALIAALLVVVLARLAAAEGRRRAAMVPVAVASALLAGSVALATVQALGVAIPLDSDLLQNAVLLAVPVGVLIAALREPAGVDEHAVPGRRRLDEAARERYRFGAAAVGGAIVVVLAVCVVLGTGGFTDRPSSGPAPVPGPAIVAP